MIGIVGVFAQLERELTGERVKAAMLVRAQKGRRTCSVVTGYDRSGKDSLKINAVEAEYIRFLFGKYLERKNFIEVARLAREAGYRGKRGGMPDAWHVERILTNPIYAGYNVFRGEIFKANHEPIISVSDFNRVQRLINRQAKIGAPRKKKLYLLPCIKQEV